MGNNRYEKIIQNAGKIIILKPFTANQVKGNGKVNKAINDLFLSSLGEFARLNKDCCSIQKEWTPFLWSEITVFPFLFASFLQAGKKVALFSQDWLVPNVKRRRSRQGKLDLSITMADYPEKTLLVIEYKHYGDMVNRRKGKIPKYAIDIWHDTHKKFGKISYNTRKEWKKLAANVFEVIMLSLVVGEIPKDAEENDAIDQMGAYQQIIDIFTEQLANKSEEPNFSAVWELHDYLSGKVESAEGEKYSAVLFLAHLAVSNSCKLG